MLNRIAGTIEIAFELTCARLWTNRCIKKALLESGTMISAAPTDHYCLLADQVISWVCQKAPIHFNCIHRSIAAIRFLRRRKVAALLKIAPTPAYSTDFMAHAWVEIPSWGTIGIPVDGVPTFQTKEVRED